MPNDAQANSNGNKVAKDKKKVFDPGIKRILWGATGLLVLLLVFTFVQRSGRIPFFTQNLLSLVVLVVIAIQSYIYRGQWEAMQDGLERTDKVIANMDEQLVQMKLQHVTNQGQIMIAAEAVEASKRSARAAEESVHLMAQSQRPDIALSLKFGVLEVGKPIPFEFEAFNAGKETAYNFGIHISCDWKPVGFDGVLDYGKPKHEAAEPIRPQTRRYIHPQWFYPLQPHELFTLMNETVWLFVYGILWYEDGAGKRYSEPFCRRFNRGSPQDAVECPYTIRERMVEEPEQAGE